MLLIPPVQLYPESSRPVAVTVDWLLRSCSRQQRSYASKAMGTVARCRHSFAFKMSGGRVPAAGHHVRICRESFDTEVKIHRDLSSSSRSFHARMSRRHPLDLRRRTESNHICGSLDCSTSSRLETSSTKSFVLLSVRSATVRILGTSFRYLWSTWSFDSFCVV
ncbi:hypothetical protein PENSPDRAFT_103188 [Peniophora sp. CONT]|nr:hypothetical protein PENSPDRAFT_103188 [Peniophora sp. CONT]